MEGVRRWGAAPSLIHLRVQLAEGRARTTEQTQLQTR